MGSYDPSQADEYFMGGGSLDQWFDALVHTRRITATHLMGARGDNRGCPIYRPGWPDEGIELSVAEAICAALTCQPA